MAKKYHALKLIPPRPTFAQDMTQEERNIMQQHVAYWTNLMRQGNAIAFGPVLDRKGVYGLGIVSVDNEEQLNELFYLRAILTRSIPYTFYKYNNRSGL